MSIVILTLKTISNLIILILGMVTMCYMIEPVENIIFHWFENNADYPGNHVLTTIAAVFFNIVVISSLHSIYIILAITASNFIDKRHKQDLEIIQQEDYSYSPE